MKENGQRGTSPAAGGKEAVLTPPPREPRASPVRSTIRGSMSRIFRLLPSCGRSPAGSSRRSNCMYWAWSPPLRVSFSGSRNLPYYKCCVANARPKHGNTGPDISRADFFWALMCAPRGWNVDEITVHLKELSSKSRTDGDGYALRTAKKAADAHDRQPHTAAVPDSAIAHSVLR
jgi:hypothetical protein